MKKKVIIIDDSTIALNITEKFFARNNWEVYAFYSAKIAYNMIFKLAPDLIITDATMPSVGGFALLKMIRKNPSISKIPVIICAESDANNAKFYLREERSEYFLKKENNSDELLALSLKTVEKFPIDDDYKIQILEAAEAEIEQEKKIYPQKQEKEEKKLKDDFDFAKNYKEIFKDFFENLFEIFEYDLCTICTTLAENKEKTVYFDLKNTLLSPIFQNFILTKYETKSCVLYKKYAPNLTTVHSEEEFLSKFELNFSNARLCFYSKEKQKWNDKAQDEEIKNKIENFFMTFKINKISLEKRNAKNKYRNSDIFQKIEESKHALDAFFAIIQITNFSQLDSILTFEETDIINSKISQTIINNIEPDELVLKNDKDEYFVVIFAKNQQQAELKLKRLANMIDNVYYDGYGPQTIIGSASCNIDGIFDIEEAQKIARSALDLTSEQEKMVIKNAGK